VQYTGMDLSILRCTSALSTSADLKQYTENESEYTDQLAALVLSVPFQRARSEKQLLIQSCRH
jgi:hypothetical protein